MTLYLINYVKVDENEFRKCLNARLLEQCNNKYQAFVECWKAYCKLTVNHTVVVGNQRFNMEVVE